MLLVILCCVKYEFSHLPFGFFSFLAGDILVSLPATRTRVLSNPGVMCPRCVSGFVAYCAPIRLFHHKEVFNGCFVSVVPRSSRPSRSLRHLDVGRIKFCDVWDHLRVHQGLTDRGG